MPAPEYITPSTPDSSPLPSPSVILASIHTSTPSSTSPTASVHATSELRYLLGHPGACSSKSDSKPSLSSKCKPCIRDFKPTKKHVKNISKLRKRARVWPTDFYVSEVAEGLAFIQNGRSQRLGTIPQLYSRFYGQDYVASMFKTNRALWDEQVPEELKKWFIGYGKTHRGSWRFFLYAFHHDGKEKPYASDAETSASESPASDSDVEVLSDSYDIINLTTERAVPSSSLKSLRQATSMTMHPTDAEDPAVAASTSTDSLANRRCLFCNDTLPPVLSPKLQVTLNQLLLPKNSYHSPTADNKLAREHHGGHGWTLRMAFCGGHFEEMSMREEANGKTWPLPADLDFDCLPERI
jgi:hypothetical protein